jgi:HAD superfamily phosphatase (TIGR01668 family)
MVNILQGWKRKSKNYLPKYADMLADIEIDLLLKSEVKGIILDLDNTIVSEDDRYLSPGAEKWITAAKLAGLQFFILSNGKRGERVKYWSSRLNITAISPAKKPFPPSFQRARMQMQLPFKHIIVIGDSLHTDAMGAFLSGCLFLQVASLPHPPRWWEKIAGKWIQKPYPATKELWDFDANFEQ